MNNKDMVSEFVRDALVAGRSRDEIAQALSDAGWTGSKVSEGLDGYAAGDFIPPVPRPRSTVNARDFFIYALMFGALCFAATNLIVLLHGLIDILLEDGANSRSRNNMRFAIAVLCVAAPLFGWLNWREGRKVLVDPAMLRSVIRKWMIYVTLLAAASVICGALVTTIYEFLKGELSVQFALKAGAVIVVGMLIFTFYRRESARSSS